eukprot:1154282-Pelagomonas_calceolata.AAC.1
MRCLNGSQMRVLSGPSAYEAWMDRILLEFYMLEEEEEVVAEACRLPWIPSLSSSASHISLCAWPLRLRRLLF